MVLRDRKLVIETKFERSGFELLGVIDPRRGAVAEMPFADEAGGVAVLLQERGDRGARRLDEEWIEGVGDATVIERRAPTVAACDERVARRRANRRRRIGIGETSPFARETVEVGRLNERGIGAVGTKAPVAEVIGEDDEDVGRERSGRQGEGKASDGECGEDADHGGEGSGDGSSSLATACSPRITLPAKPVRRR